MEPVPETEEALEELMKYGDSELGQSLRTMGQKARAIVPECVGMSLAVLEDGLTFTLVASSTEAAELDAVQYLDGGPCVEGVEQQQILDVNAGDLLSEGRWLMYAQASAAAGVASSLSLPIVEDRAVVGGINLYASSVRAFVGQHDALADALGASAAGAITNADLSFSTRERAAEAPTILADRHDLDLALGIIMTQRGVDIATARARLQHAAARAGIGEAQAARAIRHLYGAA